MFWWLVSLFRGLHPGNVASRWCEGCQQHVLLQQWGADRRFPWSGVVPTGKYSQMHLQSGNWGLAVDRSHGGFRLVSLCDHMAPCERSPDVQRWRFGWHGDRFWYPSLQSCWLQQCGPRCAQQRPRLLWRGVDWWYHQLWAYRGWRICPKSLSILLLLSWGRPVIFPNTAHIGFFHIGRNIYIFQLYSSPFRMILRLWHRALKALAKYNPCLPFTNWQSSIHTLTMRIWNLCRYGHWNLSPVIC